MTHHTITTDLDTAALASRISDPDRTRPILVATCPPGSHTPAVDTTTLVHGLPKGLEVQLYIVAEPHTTTLNQRLGADAAVWGGAVRIYPAGQAPDAGYYWKADAAPTPTALAQRIINDLTPPPQTNSAPTAVGSSHSPGLVTTADQAEALARHLLDPTRTRPVVLVSIPVGRTQPWADVDELHASLADQCTITTITTGTATRALAAQLPHGCEAYGGAARVYPPGTAWLTNWDAAPLRFAADPTDGNWQTRTLIRDAYHALPPTTHTSTTTPTARPAAGTITGLVAGRALVRLDDGQMATIWPESLQTDLDIGHLLSVGMRVHGLHHRDMGRLDISAMRQDPAAALSHYRPGGQILVQIATITDQALEVTIHPGITGSIAADQVTASNTPLADLVSVGEVLVARILRTTPIWQLSLDVDDHQPLTPPAAYLEGGPAWITPPEPEPEPTAEPDIAEDAAAPAHDVDARAVQEWQAERDQLAAQLQRAKAQTRQAKEQAKQARTKLRAVTQDRDRLARELAHLQQDTSRAAADHNLFADPVDQLRFDVEIAWARRIPAGQKQALPLKPWTVGPTFLSSLDQTPDVDRAKLVDVIVEICTGLVEQMPGRDLHQLRTSDAGNAAPMTRSDGAVCWRAALQQNTPQARRIHYWMRRDQMIELSSVRLHDDLRP